MLMEHPWIKQAALSGSSKRQARSDGTSTIKSNLRNNLTKLSSQDNMITPWEFLLLSNLAWMKIKKADIKASSKVFEQFDKDKNGFVDKADFQAVMQELGLKTDKEGWARAWERID